MPPSIPERWIPYKAFGTIIEGTRLICFKVPLRTAVQTHNPQIKEIWDIKTLLQKIPKLGAVIDLTNTSRYYDPADLRAAGVLHKKIMMPGRVLPPESTVEDFMDTVDEILGKDCDLVVGVHCTHGLNRTGYMVCRYMRDRLKIPAKDAIKKFEKARGYEMERENYIADLLGIDPPPPDIGKETKVKPLSRRESATYRSPRKSNDDDDDSSSKFGPRYGRYERHSKRSESEERSHRKGKSKSNTNYRDRSPKRKKRNDSDSYDYAFDY